ncbi:hypothetical protein CAOG_04292 [Capsaspora owczarzaki ATCC 30864]|uniref:Autophagy protein 5 n=1 Tax=Capsaspora owczarzaki (strain ATCC 30864) TaxID=595528 RepID=A0A0D2WQY8_CAPO3|nr:hypothetical protein CAOG_04292 [Capsaspora owczarzaki ATCC 30864]KJE93513.1 hypothetical protein CAOG_004292 [Capsaspora owczarzaki ATCC 30864]|eukprot:XP_004348117.1 hypothetical protein CAOG_04292 [Capsaspora owczarzaki ATCC 30864]
MADDREIERQIWEGKVPIVFNLAQSEVTGDEPPEPYYLLAPRCSYLPLVTTKVKKHFQSTGTDTEDEMWFDYAGQALKWHYPIGVLFDFYGSPSQLPWSVTVHFQGFPEDEVLRCPDKETVETHMIATIKEADYLKNGSTKKLLAMLKKDQKQLWMGLKTFKFDQFWSVNKRLTQRDETDPFKNVPFRIYVPDQPVLQEPFPPFRQDGSEYTLGDLLATVLPELFPAERVSPFLVAFNAAAAEARAAEGGAPEDVPVAPPSSLGKQVELPQIVLHGISPAFETPLLWLGEHCCYPDNFLHICILPSELTA